MASRDEGQLFNPGYTLIGSFNNWDTNDASRTFTQNPTYPHLFTLTLDNLSGSFQVAPTTSNIQTPTADIYLHGEHYGASRENILNGETVKLDKYVNNAVSTDNNIYMSYRSGMMDKVTQPNRITGSKLIWSNIYLGNQTDEDSSYLYFLNQESTGSYAESTVEYGCASPVAIPAYASIPDTGYSIGICTAYNAANDGSSYISSMEDSNKWVVDWKASDTYDIVFDIYTKEVVVFKSSATPYRSPARVAASVPTTPRMRLLSGSLDNVTLVFNSRTQELTFTTEKPAYSLVVGYYETIDGVPVQQLKTYRMIETTVEDSSGEHTVYYTSVAKIPAGAGVCVLKDGVSVDKFYGAASEGANLTESVSLSAVGADYTSHVFHVGSTLIDATFTLGLGDFGSTTPTQLSYSTAGSDSYRLVGYYGGWYVDYSYAFTKIGDHYELYVPELPLCGATASGDVGFKIAKVVGSNVTYYGSSTELSASGVEGASGETIELVENGNNIVLSDMKAHQWFDACLLTLTVPDGSLSKRRGAAGTPSLNVKSTIATTVEDVANDDEPADVYSLTGVCVKRNAAAEDLHDLGKGIYIYKGKKLIIK